MNVRTLDVELGESGDLVSREQLRLDDKRIGFAVPGFHGVRIVDEQKWECLRCGSEESRPVFEGEQPSPPVYCGNCDRKTGFELVDSPAVIEPEWTPPQGVEECGAGELFGDIRYYIRGHVNLDHGFLYTGLAVWALMTWHKEAFPFASHLCILAPTMSGKTRLCRTLSEVSYRGYNAGGSSESSLFRSIDSHNVTPFVSEFTGLPSDTRNQIHNIIRVSQKRGEPVARSVRRGDQWVVRSFDTFTPMAVASQHDFPDDVKNRSIVLEMHHEPGGIEPVLKRARGLRDRLLFWRFRYGKEIRDELEPVIEDLYDKGIRGRLLEQLAPLVATARVCDVDLGDFVEWQRKRHQMVVEEQVHVVVCKILSERIRDNESLRVCDVVEEFNERTGSDWSSQRMGRKLSDLGVETRRGSDMKMVVDDVSAAEAIELHAAPHGVEVPDVGEQKTL